VFDLIATSVEERLEQVRQLTHGEGVDVVVEAAGSPRAFEEGSYLARDGGRYIVAGHYTDAGSSSVNAHTAINRKHLDVRVLAVYGGQPYGRPDQGYGGQPDYGRYGEAPGGAGYAEPGYGEPGGGGYDYGQPAGQGYGGGYAEGGYAAGGATVTLQLDDGSGRTYQLREGANVIGRGQDAQFRLPDTGVSRRHLEIRWDGQVALLSDLNSTNGTTVNNAPVQEWQLADGDVIRLGHSEIIVRVH